MSAGDIDDRLGPEGELERLRAGNTELDSYLQTLDSIPIHRAGVPFGAGISQSGNAVYIDPRLDTDLDGVNLDRALATHEVVEWGLRQYAKIGVDYDYDPRGHRIANRAEYNTVAGLFPDLDLEDAWEKYDEFIDPQIRRIEGEPLSGVPSDLATYPYEDDEAMMKKIKEAQRGEA
jgi:hypothetical protein